MRQSELERQEALKELEENEVEVNLEKGDNLALNISAILMLGLPCLLLICIIMAVVLWLFT